MSQGSICSHLGSEIEDKWFNSEICVRDGERKLIQWGCCYLYVNDSKLMICSTSYPSSVCYLTCRLILFFIIKSLFFLFPLLDLQRSEAQRVFLKRWDWRRTGAQNNVNLWLQQPQPKQIPGCCKYLCIHPVFFFLMCVCWQQRRQRFFSLSPLLVHPGCLTLLWMLFSLSTFVVFLLLSPFALLSLSCLTFCNRPLAIL